MTSSSTATILLEAEHEHGEELDDYRLLSEYAAYARLEAGLDFDDYWGAVEETERYEQWMD